MTTLDIPVHEMKHSLLCLATRLLGIGVLGVCGYLLRL